MDERNYVITRYFSDYGPDFNGGRLIYDLVDMINELKNKLHLGNLLAKNVRWIMTQEMFIWLVSKCDGEYGFYYQVELSCTAPNKYSIMDIEVELVDDEYMRLSNIVKLSYKEDLWKIGAVEYMPWFKYLQRKNVEVKEEKLMKSFYVGCGKKVTIENVIFNNPATIVFWSDGTKTVVKRQRGDKKFDPEKGLAMAICKKVMGNKGNFNDIFKEWIEED